MILLTVKNPDGSLKYVEIDKDTTYEPALGEELYFDNELGEYSFQ